MTTQAAKSSRPGPKPRGPFIDKRKTMSTRLTSKTRAQLDAAAAQSGRSLSQEIELRLVLSFERDNWVQEIKDLIRGIAEK